MSAATEKMRAEGVPEVAIDTFSQQLARLRDGERGVLAESGIEPVDALPDADDLVAGDADARDALRQAVVIKLNGGLGTSMGMTGPKSLLEVKPGATFLDITALQVLHLRAQTGAALPLVLMNSFATRGPSLEALQHHPALAVEGVAADFVQSKVPKLDAATLEPVSWPADPGLEWAPPGHGDIYASLVSSGILDALLGAGLRYAFVANADNLGAVLDPTILTWFAREELPFCMEVADRTPADRKGGHLARRPGGGLVLREIAQTPEEDLGAFQDITRHRFFNTNTLWIDLEALATLLTERRGVLGLPMIVNRKTVDPADPASPKVIQLETAMGAAIDVMDGAQALRVPRSRFAPVKTTDDLLTVRSDAYALGEDGRLGLADGRRSAPDVRLDPEHYRLVADFEARFPRGAPSLVEADSLTVEGDVTFGAGVVVRGAASIEGPAVLDDGTVFDPSI